jgi:RNA polymerase sigma factor (sigma-70 family)
MARYGYQAALWPEWLQDWARSMQREVNQDRRHLSLELIENKPPDVIPGARKVKNLQNNQVLKHDVKTNSVTTSREVMEIVFPGLYPVDINKRSIYDDDSLEGLPPEDQSAAIMAKRAPDETRGLIDLTARDGTLDHIALYQFLDTLSERERLVIELRFYDELTQADIAQELGITQAAVSKIIAKVIKLGHKWQ